MSETNEKKQNMAKPIVKSILAYVIIVVLVYFLMGHQLHYRASRGNYSQPNIESATVELVDHAVVEQNFTAKIQCLYSVSVQWGTFYRQNAGTVTMELYNLTDGSLLMSQSFDASTITESSFTTMSVETPIETVYDVPLQLRIWGDCEPGKAVSPMMAGSAREDDFSLVLNGTPTEGVLCFSVSGEDYIWTGLHYWEFAAGFGALLAAACLLVWHRWKKGKRSYVVNALMAAKKYKFLIRQLVARDF